MSCTCSTHEKYNSYNIFDAMSQRRDQLGDLSVNEYNIKMDIGETKRD
jgi:hypothetical protein